MNQQLKNHFIAINNIANTTLTAELKYLIGSTKATPLEATAALTSKLLEDGYNPLEARYMVDTALYYFYSQETPVKADIGVKSGIDLASLSKLSK